MYTNIKLFFQYKNNLFQGEHGGKNKKFQIGGGKRNMVQGHLGQKV
jgi:hypothetical protein